MCTICLRNTDFTPEHVSESIKAIGSQVELNEKRQSIRASIKQLETWVLSGHITGFEKSMIENQLVDLKLVEKELNHYM